MDNEPQNVVITNLKIPFFSLMVFMIKWVVASIPALILLAVLGAGIMLVDHQVGGIVNMIEGFL